jgi:hypothetical protein
MAEANHEIPEPIRVDLPISLRLFIAPAVAGSLGFFTGRVSSRAALCFPKLNEKPAVSSPPRRSRPSSSWPRMPTGSLRPFKAGTSIKRPRTTASCWLVRFAKFAQAVAELWDRLQGRCEDGAEADRLDERLCGDAGGYRPPARVAHRRSSQCAKDGQRLPSWTLRRRASFVQL